MFILKALPGGAMSGSGLALRLRVQSGKVFRVETGSLYPALCRLEAKGLIQSEWNVSEANRKARFYLLTPSGRKYPKAEIDRWQVVSLQSTAWFERRLSGYAALRKF